MEDCYCIVQNSALFVDLLKNFFYNQKESSKTNVSLLEAYTEYQCRRVKFGVGQFTGAKVDLHNFKRYLLQINNIFCYN